MKRSGGPLVLATVFGIGLSLSIAGYLFTRHIEQQQLTSRFQHQIDLRADALRQRLQVSIEAIRGLRGLYNASESVERNEFRLYSAQLLEHHPEIQALEWIPRLQRNQLSRYADLALADGLEDFRFSELSDGGVRALSSDRELYYPVYYIEPLVGNEPALGLDLGSSKSRLGTLMLARDSGTLVATAPIRLIQETAQQQGFLVLAPLYRSAADNPRDRQHRHYGFVLGVFRAGDLFSHSQRPFADSTPGTEIKIEDITVPGNPVPVAQQRYGDPEASLISDSYRVPVHIADRQWQLSARYSVEFARTAHDNSAWFVLVAGALLSLFGTGMLSTVFSKHAEVEARVQHRTRELRESENKISAIVETVIDAIITIDDKGAVQSFNPAAEQMFGYSYDEVHGRNVSMLMPEPFRSEHDGYLRHHIETGETHIIGIGREVTGLRRDGSTFPLSLSVGRVELDDQVLFVGSLIDQTLQKQIQQQLIDARDKAEAANRQKSSFVNMMSHELRTPLTVILGYLPLLRNSGNAPSAETVAEIAEDMNASGQHLLELINDLLDISRIEAGQLHLSLRPLNAADVCANAVGKLQGTAEARGLQLINRAGDADILADAIRLQQILINLIGNAIKFTDQGTITLSTRNLEGFTEFVVEDTGQGIEADQLARVFERFHQADNSSTRNAGGSGLGLAISRHLVTLHGGEIRVTSEPGVGSRFVFTIPASGD